MNNNKKPNKKENNVSKNNSEEKKDKNAHDDNDDPNNNVFMNKINISNNFINEQLYPIVHNYKNINLKNLEIKVIIGMSWQLFI